MSETKAELVPEARVSWLFRLGLILAAILGMLFVFSCGGIALLMGTIETADTPAKVADLKQEILSIDLPESYQPSGGVRSKWLDFRLISYTQPEPPAYFILLSSSHGRERMEQFVQDEKQRLQIEPVTIKSTETLVVEILNQAVELQIASALGKKTESEFKRIRCEFSKDDQHIFLEWIVTEREYKKEQIEETLRNIK